MAIFLDFFEILHFFGPPPYAYGPLSKKNHAFGLNLLGALEEKYIDLTKKELGDFIKCFLRYTAPNFEKFKKTRTEKNAKN